MSIKGSLLGKGSEGGCYERGNKGHDKVKHINNTNRNSRSYLQTFGIPCTEYLWCR